MTLVAPRCIGTQRNGPSAGELLRPSVGCAEGQSARFIKSQIRGLFLTNPVLEFGQGVHGHWTPASDWPRPLPPIGRGFSSTVEGLLDRP
jgi:hypothetical protein